MQRKLYTGSEGDIWAAFFFSAARSSPSRFLAHSSLSPQLEQGGAAPVWVAVKVVHQGTATAPYRALEPLWPALCAHRHVAEVLAAEPELHPYLQVGEGAATDGGRYFLTQRLYEGDLLEMTRQSSGWRLPESLAARLIKQVGPSRMLTVITCVSGIRTSYLEK